MPVVDGVELIRRLRSEPRTSAIPIIVVSSDLDRVQDLHAAGLVDAIVTKPLDAAKFTECVRSVTESPTNQLQMESAMWNG
jgi:CheY-like chemotaxis protein